VNHVTTHRRILAKAVWYPLIAALMLILQVTPATAAVHIRAGLEQNPPLSFVDSQGKASGLLVELLDYVAAKEGWQIAYLPDTLDRCLEKLETGEIDLMVTIALTKERSERYDFNLVSVIANWGQLYTGKGLTVQSYFDMDGKRIAVVKGDSHQQAFRSMLDKFGIKAQYLPVDNFDQVFSALEEKRADAGVVGRFYALKNEDKFMVQATPLIFNPIEVHYAAPKGINGHIIAALDRNLEALKNDRNSFYYQSLDRWFGTVHKSGVPKWIKVSLVTAGCIVCILIAFTVILRRQVKLRTQHLVREVGERKRAEEALQAQLTQVSTIFDSIKAVVYVADMNSNELLYLNKHGRLLFGNDWLGKNCYQLFSLEQTDVSTIPTPERLVKDGKPQPPTEWEFWDPASDRWYQCIDRAIRWSDDRFARMVIAFDITDHKEMERTKDEMISAVSHEMRTPLTAMLGYSEFMLHGDISSDQQKQYLRTLYTETERLYELVDNFLYLQRRSAQKSSQHFGLVHIEPLIRETTALFGPASPKHRLTVSAPSDLPPVRGDFEELHRVFNNLVSNAIKYSPEGGDVSVEACKDAETIIITVRDEGIGIPTRYREKIFERFFRVDNTDSRLFGGIGLGLSLVKEIIDAHGGRIWVESTPGKGSSFFVALPIAHEMAETVPS